VKIGLSLLSKKETMISIKKDYLKPQQTKYLINVVMELIRSNENMKHEMKVAIAPQYIDSEDNVLGVLMVSLITFCFLMSMKYLHKISTQNTFHIESQYDLNKMIYSAVVLQLIYLSMYLRFKKNSFLKS
jgi:hypothetical protein